MSFGGPPPSATPPSGPFEMTLTQISSSPYTLAAAIFLLNIGGRFLPAEISKQQEAYLNTPWFRRLIIYVIFFVATRNLMTAFMLGTVSILVIGYLFNENSPICIFGKGGLENASCKTQATVLSPEEQEILKKLSEKAAKVQQEAAKPIELGNKKAVEKHQQYRKVLRGIWQNLTGL